MNAAQIRAAVVATLLVVPLAACGSQEGGAPEVDTASSPSASSSGQQEEITPGGVALIVLDHLGEDAVKQVFTFSGEDGEGDIGVMVRLRDRTPHNFSVSVYPPEAAEEFGAAGECPPPMRERRGETSECRTLDDGTTVMTTQMPYGFSDDNRNGTFLMSSASSERGVAMAMYESYDESPAISTTDLEELLADPRLAWLTDPEVNSAGEEVEVKEVSG